MRLMWGMALAGLWVACDDEPPECETQQATTCLSSLLIQRRNNDDTDFLARLTLPSEGIELPIRCPLLPEGDGIDGDIQWFCGAGQVTFTRPGSWPDTVEVSFGTSEPIEVMPDYNAGLDLCGNSCNNGVIEL